MATKRKRKAGVRQSLGRNVQTVEFYVRKHRVHILLDKVLFLRFLNHLHGRFWGIAGICLMIIGFAICFSIRPHMLAPGTALSEFGNDVRTAPYFAASVFFGAYGLWRWQRYLKRTWKHAMPVTGLVSLTVIGLYLVALMPVSWQPWPYRVHMFGVFLVGICITATVVLDGLLTRISLRKDVQTWRLVRLLSLILIIGGGWLTFGSAAIVGWYQLALVGEIMLIGGYLMWVVFKTYVGEGNRTVLARIVKRIVLID